MLKIYENGVPEHPLNVRAPDWYIEHRYEGNDVLKFEIPDTHDAYGHLAEEIRITDGKNLYAVKKMDDHGGYVNVECGLDLDDWRERFWKSFRTTNSTLQQVFDQIKPSGWTLSGAEGITQRATIEASEGKGLENVTAETILSRASEVYEVVFNFAVLDKTVTVIDPTKYTSSGDYLTDELNLKSVGFVGNTSEFATRLYAYGKKDADGNPVTIVSVNGGKEYIDNHQYSDRIISVGWSDERYTIPQNLLDAAKKKLDELSYPSRSYECDVRNLDGDMYIYKVVTLVDRKRKLRTDHRVVTYKEYPKAHHLDVVTLSAVPPKIETTVKGISTQIDQKVAASQKAASDAALEAIKIVTGQNGGHVKIEMQDGIPEAVKVRHTDGSETVLDKNGVHRSNRPYLYLVEQGSIEFDPEIGETKVQLSEAYIGHGISVTLSLKSVEPQNSTDVLQTLDMSWEYEIETGTVTLRADCYMLNVETRIQTAPKKLTIDYCITGR